PSTSPHVIRRRGPATTRHPRSFPTRRSSDLASSADPSCCRNVIPRRHPVVTVRRYQAARRTLEARHGSLDAAPPSPPDPPRSVKDRKSTRLNSSHVKTAYAVFCLQKKTRT